jgi:N-carbamoylputrescine amidase
MNSNTICVAAIQPICRPGPVADNLAHLETLISEAASRGAQLALLPERFTEAFRFDESAWLAASPAGGAVENWLYEMSRKYRLYLGGSYLEARGEDFYNSFLLSGPEEGTLGSVGKDHPCSIEAYTFKPQPGSQVIDRPLGRIGVAICYDNSLRTVWDRLLAEGFDLFLMPMSAPTPQRNFYYNERRVAAYHDSFRDGATLMAERLGVPAIMANKAGPWETPLPGWLPDIRSSFPGFSHIADSDGRELARLNAEEGVVVAQVTLDPAGKHLGLPPDADRYHPWVVPVPLDYKTFALFEFFGRRNYQRNKRRAELARRAVREDAV